MRRAVVRPRLRRLLRPLIHPSYSLRNASDSIPATDFELDAGSILRLLGAALDPSHYFPSIVHRTIASFLSLSPSVDSRDAADVLIAAVSVGHVDATLCTSAFHVAVKRFIESDCTVAADASRATAAAAAYSVILAMHPNKAVSAAALKWHSIAVSGSIHLLQRSQVPVRGDAIAKRLALYAAAASIVADEVLSARALSSLQPSEPRASARIDGQHASPTPVDIQPLIHALMASVHDGTLVPPPAPLPDRVESTALSQQSTPAVAYAVPHSDGSMPAPPDDSPTPPTPPVTPRTPIDALWDTAAQAFTAAATPLNAAPLAVTMTHLDATAPAADCAAGAADWPSAEEFAGVHTASATAAPRHCLGQAILAALAAAPTTAPSGGGCAAHVEADSLGVHGGLVLAIDDTTGVVRSTVRVGGWALVAAAARGALMDPLQSALTSMLTQDTNEPDGCAPASSCTGPSAVAAASAASAIPPTAPAPMGRMLAHLPSLHMLRAVRIAGSVAGAVGGVATTAWTADMLPPVHGVWHTPPLAAGARGGAFVGSGLEHLSSYDLSQGMCGSQHGGVWVDESADDVSYVSRFARAALPLVATRAQHIAADQRPTGPDRTVPTAPAHHDLFAGFGAMVNPGAAPDGPSLAASSAPLSRAARSPPPRMVRGAASGAGARAGSAARSPRTSTAAPGAPLHTHADPTVQTSAAWPAVAVSTMPTAAPPAGNREPYPPTVTAPPSPPPSPLRPSRSAPVVTHRSSRAPFIAPPPSRGSSPVATAHGAPTTPPALLSATPPTDALLALPPAAFAVAALRLRGRRSPTAPSPADSPAPSTSPAARATDADASPPSAPRDPPLIFPLATRADAHVPYDGHDYDADVARLRAVASAPTAAATADATTAGGAVPRLRDGEASAPDQCAHTPSADEPVPHRAAVVASLPATAPLPLRAHEVLAALHGCPAALDAALLAFTDEELSLLCRIPCTSTAYNGPYHEAFFAAAVRRFVGVARAADGTVVPPPSLPLREAMRTVEGLYAHFISRAPHARAVTYGSVTARHVRLAALSIASSPLIPAGLKAAPVALAGTAVRIFAADPMVVSHPPALPRATLAAFADVARRVAVATAERIAAGGRGDARGDTVAPPRTRPQGTSGPRRATRVRDRSVPATPPGAEARLDTADGSDSAVATPPATQPLYAPADVARALTAVRVVAAALRVRPVVPTAALAAPDLAVNWSPRPDDLAAAADAEVSPAGFGSSSSGPDDILADDVTDLNKRWVSHNAWVRVGPRAPVVVVPRPGDRGQTSASVDVGADAGADDAAGAALATALQALVFAVLPTPARTAANVPRVAGSMAFTDSWGGAVWSHSRGVSTPLPCELVDPASAMSLLPPLVLSSLLMDAVGALWGRQAPFMGAYMHAKTRPQSPPAAVVDVWAVVAHAAPYILALAESVAPSTLHAWSQAVAALGALPFPPQLLLPASPPTQHDGAAGQYVHARDAPSTAITSATAVALATFVHASARRAVATPAAAAAPNVLRAVTALVTSPLALVSFTVVGRSLQAARLRAARRLADASLSPARRRRSAPRDATSATDVDGTPAEGRVPVALQPSNGVARSTSRRPSPRLHYVPTDAAAVVVPRTAGELGRFLLRRQSPAVVIPLLHASARAATAVVRECIGRVNGPQQVGSGASYSVSSGSAAEYTANHFAATYRILPAVTAPFIASSSSDPATLPGGVTAAKAPAPGPILSTVGSAQFALDALGLMGVRVTTYPVAIATTLAALLYTTATRRRMAATYGPHHTWRSMPPSIASQFDPLWASVLEFLCSPAAVADQAPPLYTRTAAIVGTWSSSQRLRANALAVGLVYLQRMIGFDNEALATLRDAAAREGSISHDTRREGDAVDVFDHPDHALTASVPQGTAPPPPSVPRAPITAGRSAPSTASRSSLSSLLSLPPPSTAADLAQRRSAVLASLQLSACVPLAATSVRDVNAHLAVQTAVLAPFLLGAVASAPTGQSYTPGAQLKGGAPRRADKATPPLGWVPLPALLLALRSVASLAAVHSALPAVPDPFDDPFSPSYSDAAAAHQPSLPPHPPLVPQAQTPPHTLTALRRVAAHGSSLQSRTAAAAAAAAHRQVDKAFLAGTHAAPRGAHAYHAVDTAALPLHTAAATALLGATAFAVPRLDSAVIARVVTLGAAGAARPAAATLAATIVHALCAVDRVIANRPTLPRGTPAGAVPAFGARGRAAPRGHARRRLRPTGPVRARHAAAADAAAAPTEGTAANGSTAEVGNDRAASVAAPETARRSGGSSRRTRLRNGASGRGSAVIIAPVPAPAVQRPHGPVVSALRRRHSAAVRAAETVMYTACVFRVPHPVAYAAVARALVTVYAVMAEAAAAAPSRGCPPGANPGASLDAYDDKTMVGEPHFPHAGPAAPEGATVAHGFHPAAVDAVATWPAARRLLAAVADTVAVSTHRDAASAAGGSGAMPTHPLYAAVRVEVEEVAAAQFIPEWGRSGSAARARRARRPTPSRAHAATGDNMWPTSAARGDALDDSKEPTVDPYMVDTVDASVVGADVARALREELMHAMQAEAAVDVASPIGALRVNQAGVGQQSGTSIGKVAGDAAPAV